MNTLPHVWSQGQLFVFSALDGVSLFSNDMIGITAGDKIGVRFFTKTKRELAFARLNNLSITFNAVTSDLISVTVADHGELNLIYAEPRLVIGTAVEPVVPYVAVEGYSTTEYCDDIEIHNTHDHQYTAFGKSGDQFAFACGVSVEEVCAAVKRGLAMDVTAEKEKKLNYFTRYGGKVKGTYEQLYNKCLSVMKSQLYSPEGRFTQMWSTPDRLPHKKLWLWDSVFHALGFRNLDPTLAQDLILSMLQTQQENGFIPHMSTPTISSRITQPPVIAWGAYHVYQTSGDKEFLRHAYTCNARFLSWCRDNRREVDDELYTWLISEELHCRCDESGMDNSPRFDKDTRLAAIDFSCFMANEARYMTRIAEELGDTDGVDRYRTWFEQIKTAINTTLWCAEDGFYYDYDINEHHLHKIESVASFLPLFAGICDEQQAAALVAQLNDPAAFGCEFPIPSISKRDATFGTDMWRGPVWINYNYMISEGLADYGYTAKARAIVEKTADVLDEWYQKTGTIYEFYDSENKKAPRALNRKGLPFEPYDFSVLCQSIRDYGWSNTLTLDMLCHL